MKRASLSNLAFQAAAEIVHSAPPNICLITLVVEHTEASNCNFIGGLEKLPWGQLDAALARLPKLREVHLNSKRSELAGKDLDYIDMLQKKMPILVATQKLQIRVR